MKFQIGDKVVVQGPFNNQGLAKPDDFKGLVGIVVCTPHDRGVNAYGVNFGKKIRTTYRNHDNWLLTHNLNGVLHHPYGRYFSEEEIELLEISYPSEINILTSDGMEELI